jgi:hypothetical protein
MESKMLMVTNTRVDEPRDIKDFFITISPANDDTIINENVATMQWIAINRKQTWLPISYGKTGIVASRQMCLEALKNYFPKQKYARALWLDSDMRVISASKLLEAINYADEHNINIVANYKRGQPPIYDNTVYIRKVPDGKGGLRDITEAEREASSEYEGERYDVPMTNTELKNHPDYGVVDYAGMGCVWGWVPLTYTFHTDNVGEDFYYFRDNSIKIRLAKQIQFSHRQSVWLHEYSHEQITQFMKDLWSVNKAEFIIALQEAGILEELEMME